MNPAPYYGAGFGRIPFVRLSKKQITAFQEKIFSWWKTNRRDLPWRHTHNPYKILVSEVMLQQTQVFRVIPKYAEFIEAYPTARSLANASTADVLRLWKGMGYNRRALYLKRAAEIGKFPNNETELAKLPGVGTYTARAILVFAYRENEPLVDTNIRRIITHFFFDNKPQKERAIEKVARRLLPKGKSWEWHQALMDYGALELNVPRITHNASRITPFRESNRFYRGRIVDRLREGNLKQTTLIEEFTGRYGKSRDFIEEILVGLTRDGLISRSTNGTISLPL